MVLIKTSYKDSPEKTDYVLGFLGGLNKLQDESLIKNNELSASENAILVVDGIKKRAGTENFGSESGSAVKGAIGYYTYGGDRFIIRENGTNLAYYNATNEPTNITMTPSASITTATRCEFVTARDICYFVNSADFLAKVQVTGGVPTATKFTAITTPVNLAHTHTGATASTTYSYQVSAINATGETLACNALDITDGPATLSTTLAINLSWDAVANATGYVIYGRQRSVDNGIGRTKLAVVSTNAYTDDGTDEPSTILTVPEGNSTGGQKGSMIIYAMSRLFIAGDTSNPSRLYYSAGAIQIDDFSVGNGGGWVDIAKNDGTKITAIKYYQNYVIVFKDRSIYRFNFTSAGLPQLEMITNEVGCCSFRTVQIADNNLWFGAVVDGQFAVYSLGQVSGYVAGTLRTTRQSVKVEAGTHMDAVNIAYASNICATYFRNLYIVCVPHAGSTINNRCYVYDTRFDVWVGFWTGIKASQFFTYNNGTSEDLYYCSEDTGYIVKMFTGTDDNGTAINWKIQTKNFNQKMFDTYKIYRNPILWFKDVSSGSITGYFISDGVFTSGSFNIAPTISGVGFDYDLWDSIMFDTSAGSTTSTVNSDQPMEIIYRTNARSLKLELDENSGAGDFKFLGFSYKWMELAGKPLPATNRIRLSA